MIGKWGLLKKYASLVQVLLLFQLILTNYLYYINIEIVFIMNCNGYFYFHEFCKHVNLIKKSWFQRKIPSSLELVSFFDMCETCTIYCPFKFWHGRNWKRFELPRPVCLVLSCLVFRSVTFSTMTPRGRYLSAFMWQVIDIFWFGTTGNIINKMKQEHCLLDLAQNNSWYNWPLTNAVSVWMKFIHVNGFRAWLTFFMRG